MAEFAGRDKLKEAGRLGRLSLPRQSSPTSCVLRNKSRVPRDRGEPAEEGRGEDATPSCSSCVATRGVTCCVDLRMKTTYVWAGHTLTKVASKRPQSVRESRPQSRP